MSHFVVDAIKSDTRYVGSSRRTRAIFGIAWRESRTARRRLLLYMSSISLGVAALVAIDSFSDNVIRSVHEQSRALLGGDVQVERNAPRTKAVDSLLDSLSKAGIVHTTATDFTSMALVPRSGGTRLVQVHAIAKGYPYYGNIITEPASAWRELQNGNNVIVDPALIVSLDAKIGDSLSLGTATFVITGTLKSVPGDVGFSAAIGPRIYMPERFVDQTGLVTFGSRAQFEILFKLPAETPASPFVSRFSKRMLDSTNGAMRSAGYNESRLAGAIDQLHDYLAVVGLVALLLGGIGVASGVHAFVMKKIDPVAILRCLGATSWQVLAIYTAQAAVMGFIGALGGVVLGIGIQFVMPYALKDFLPVDVEVRLAPMAILVGLGVGVWVALLFSLRPLVALRRVSPLQALRREPDSDALRRARWDPLRLLLSFAIGASVLGLSLSRANTVRRGVGFAVAIGVAIGVLWLSAVGLSWLARRSIRPSWPFPIRQGVASLYRPGNQTRAVVLALGFGVFLMGTLYQVQYNILRSLDLRLGEARSNVVFFDVQEAQRAGIDSIIRSGGNELIDETPIVPMRISSINGKPLADLLAAANRVRSDSARKVNRGQRGPSPWALRREFRSTFRDSLTESERIVAGHWFAAHRADSLGEVSLDTSVAGGLGVHLNDTITWNVQGVLIPTVVTSYREVKWQTLFTEFFRRVQSGVAGESAEAVRHSGALARCDVDRAFAARRRREVPRRVELGPHPHSADGDERPGKSDDGGQVPRADQSRARHSGPLQRRRRDASRATARRRAAQDSRRHAKANRADHARRVSAARHARRADGGRAVHRGRMGADALDLPLAVRAGVRTGVVGRRCDDLTRCRDRIADRPRRVRRNADGGAARDLANRRRRRWPERTRHSPTKPARRRRETIRW